MQGILNPGHTESRTQGIMYSTHRIQDTLNPGHTESRTHGTMNKLNPDQTEP